MDAAELLTHAATLSPLEAAHAYADYGLRVFPCAPGAKRPITAHGFYDATTEPGQIEVWWGEDYPVANVGIATGTPERGRGFDVLDIDVRVGGDGFTGFERARRAGLVDGWAALVRTPSGGVHAYYPTSVRRPQGCWILSYAHVDFRGIGGYVLAPPSSVDVAGRGGAGYQVIARPAHTVRSIDGNAVHDLLAERRRPPSPATTLRRAAEGVDLERLSAWVATRAEGGRNAGLYWAACRCAEAGIDDHVVQEFLGEAARTAGLPATEAAATIRSAYRTTTGSGSSPSRQSTPSPPRRQDRYGIDGPDDGVRL